MLVAVAAMTGVLALSAPPAAARVTAANDKFCAVLFGDQQVGINFEGLTPAAAASGAKLLRQATKTGVPAGLKADLGKLAKVYDRIAGGEAAAKVLDARQQQTILPVLTRFSKYVAKNCVAVPTT